MSLNIDNTLESMALAIKDVISSESPALRDCIRKALDDERQALQDIASARLAGEITDEDMQSQLEDEEAALRAVLLACQVRSKAIIQKAANAAIKVFTDAVTGAIKAAMP